MRVSAYAALAAAIAVSGCSSGPKERNPKAAQDYYDEAEKEAKKGRHMEAISYYSKALDADPEFPDAYYQRGWHYLELRKMEEPPIPSRELVDRALADYDAAIRYNPAYADAYWARAMIWASRANYRQAIEDLLICARYRDKDPDPQYWLGWIYEEKYDNMIVQAMGHYERFIELGGKDAKVLEKVKAWKQLKGGGTEPPPEKKPTADDEKKAEALHAKMLALIGEQKEADAFKALEELVTRYSNTKFFQEKAKGLQALYNALKAKYGTPK